MHFKHQFKKYLDVDISYPILIGSKKVVRDFGGIRAIPTSFLIDKKGIIREHIIGYISETYLESLIKIKFKHETRDEIMIPSRLEKRLLGIFLNRTQIQDPYYKVKALNNRRAGNALKSKAFKKDTRRSKTSCSSIYFNHPSGIFYLSSM